MSRRKTHAFAQMRCDGMADTWCGRVVERKYASFDPYNETRGMRRAATRGYIDTVHLDLCSVCRNKVINDKPRAAGDT